MGGVNQRIDFDEGFLMIRFPVVWSGQAIGDAVGMGALSALVFARDFDTFFCVRVFLFDAVA